MLKKLLLSSAMLWAFTHEALALGGQELPSDLINITIDPTIVQAANSALPERASVNPEYLSPIYNPNLGLNQAATISVSFIDEGAGYRNSLGYFAFQSGAFNGLTRGQIDKNHDGVVTPNELSKINGVEVGLIFANASKEWSGGLLKTGDTVSLGEGKSFAAGTSIGFFLTQDGWSQGSATSILHENTSRQVFYSADFLNPENEASAGYNSGLSAYSRHVAMLFADQSRTSVIMGFEDLNRINAGVNINRYATDNDFNDAIFMVRANPLSALSTARIAMAPAPGLGDMAGFLLIGSVAFFSLRRKEMKS